jgi:PAS domain S-box-containing protein
LPENSVNAMVQDHRGYLGIGTFGGLARFDGERFTVFDSADTPGFGGDQIFSLYEGRPGVLWIGTVDAGLIRLQDGVATTYTERDGLPSRFISSIRGDAEGNVWINTSRGVARFAGTRLEAYPTHRGKAVREFFLQARDGSMWFRCGGDVVRFGADGSIATLHPTKPSVFLVHEARDGSVWIAFRDQYRLVRYYQGVFSDVPLPPVERREVTGDFPLFSLAMAEDADGALLVLTPAGLSRNVNGRLGPPEALPLPASGGEPPKVRSLVMDREGDLWVGTIGTGLVRLRPAPLTAYGKAEGLSDSSFSTVFQDREGRIWLGGDLLYSFDGHRFRLVPGVVNILTIAQTRDGDLWFGGYGGFYRCRAGMLGHFKVEAPAVKAIYQDRQGTLWIGALTEERPGGLYRFRDGKLEQVPGISDVRAIAEDRDGGLWLGGLEGLQYMRGSKTILYDRKQRLSSNTVSDIHQDSTGTLWVATYGGGLNCLRDGRFRAITTKDGLPSNMLLGILDDGNGNLWLSSNQGIFRLSLKELNDFADGKISSISPVSYGVAEGMRSTESNDGSPAGWKATDGRIWFPTLRGVVAIDPTAGDRLPPPVVLEEAWANKFSLARDGQTSVPPGNHTLDFRFTALSLSAPEKVRFKYRLEPFDKDWVDAGTRRTAHYTNMAPGKYTFQVIAANSYAIWNNQGATVRFVLKPHFYQTLWFRLVLLAGVVLLVGSIHRLRVRQLHARAMQLKQLADTLQEQANLLNLTHDTIFVADMEGVIKYWNRGAEEQYGWTAEQAVGKVVHKLLKTVFPTRREEIIAEVIHTGRWEGELVHTRKDGTQIVVATRLSLQRDEQDAPVAILETNNDITERKQAEEALRRLNREVRAVSNCNQTLLRATDEQSLLEEICRIVCEEAGYRMAWVGYAEHNQDKSVRPAAWVGAEEGYLATLGITWADKERGCGPTGTAIRSGKSRCIQDFAADPRLAPWRGSALLRDFRSGIALPLKDEHASAFGSLTIYCSDPNAFTREEIRLLEELAGDLAFGVVTLRSRAARKQAEEALRESETRFRTFVDHAADALFIYDFEQGTIVDVNRQACESLGYTRQELIGTTPLAFDRNVDPAAAESIAERTAAGETVIDTHWHLRKDGTLFPVEVHTSQYSYGGRRFLLKVARDVSDRLRAEEALRQSEAYLAEAQRLSHTGSWAWSPVTRQPLYWSEEMFRIFGLSPHEGVPTAETFLQRIHPEDRNRAHELLLTAGSGNTEYEHEHRIMLPDGTIKHIHAIGHPVLDENGQVTEYVGTAMDVTERKRAEEDLRAAETRFRTYVDHASDAVFVHDERGRVLDVNRQACESLGYNREELIGMEPRDFDLDVDEALSQRISERLNAGVVCTFETRHRRKDGTVFPVEVRVRPFRQGGDRLSLALAQDITERKRAEQERERLRQLEADLAHINRVSMMGELAASIAHEVNQPLSGVVSNGSACLRWLTGNPPNVDEALENARRIVRDGKRAGEIITRIRALTKRAVTSRERLDLNETIRDVLALVGDEAKRKSVITRTQFADDLSPVSGDRVQLQQVMLNLIMNGIEAMSSVADRVRELVITTRNMDPEQVQVTVEDSGIGIDAQTIDKMFESFYTTKPGGMGMGLSISRSILQAHGGRLWATAKDGTGAIFHLTLPKRREEESHAGVA